YTSKKNDFLFGIVFGLHYVPFACGSGKIGCASTMHKQKNDYLFGIVFGLHYVPFACGSGKIGCASTMHKQKK
ncbi:MAG: hypothetical protein IJS04_08785, partial [Muribaculaceae bacterium]|nr:hypothetical protein [Muribaculaceae bacterium]